MTKSSSAGVARLELERRIAAPVSVVYEMLVDPEELKQWLGPHDFVCTVFEADVKVGGSFRFRMRKHGGAEYGADGVYRELIRDQRVVLTWCWNEAPPGEPLDRSETLVTFALRAEGDSTVLTLTHTRLPDQESADSHSAGWSDGLDKLIARIQRIQKGRPMKTETILAGIAVANIEDAIGWYGRVFGRNFDDRPMKEAAEWRLTQGGSLQLVLDKERAGKSMVTIGVSDIDELAADLQSKGLEAKAGGTPSGKFRLAQIRDPDGNLLTFAQDQRKG
jgi:uncharacterized protein YndB with AHSA1/START domain/predicted enzyme related to lactoylglutathione lyase